jgi:hypothetical protein
MTDIQHSLQTYISDMLALEEHVRIPFETQMKDADLPLYPGADALLRRISDLSNTHIAALKQALETEGGHEAHAVKGTVASIEGWFASAIDKMRKTKIAKALRDDYTALSLCCVSYSMLLTTANAYGSIAVADLALRHMRNYAEAIVEIGLLMPDVVLRDLQETGVQIDTASAAGSRGQIQSVWRPNPIEQARTTSGTIETDAAANRSSSPTYPTI